MSHLHLGEYKLGMEVIQICMKKINKRNGESKTSDNNIDFLEAVFIIGTIYRKLKQYKDAIECFNQAQKVEEMEDIPHIQFHKMLTSYERNNFKDYTKFMRQLVKKAKSLKDLIKFLQHLVFIQHRYLADEWQKVLDLLILRSREFWPRPEKVFGHLRNYRTSSLVSLHFVRKKVKCLNEK